MEHLDVMIAGGGPAGAWAARALARAGARVAVFDASHPREKPCGGGLTARALALVEPVLEEGRVPVVNVERIRFEAPPRQADPYPTRPGPAPFALVDLLRAGAVLPRPLAIVSRQTFDGALLDACRRAGATVVPERVVDVEATATDVRVRTAHHEFRAAFLLGADGAAGVVRQRLASTLPRRQVSIATGMFARDVTSRETDIRFVADPPGYLWSFPRTDHLAIGICAQAGTTTIAQLRDHVGRWRRASNLAPGATLVPYSWPIPSLDAESLANGVPAGPRWTLLGDAAGLVDPLTREGIYFALRSAELAAEALSQESGPAPGLYQAALRREVLPELVRAAIAKGSFFRPGLTRLLIDVLRESPAIRGLVVELVCGRVPYGGLRKRAIRAVEPGAAVRMLGTWVGRAFRPGR